MSIGILAILDLAAMPDRGWGPSVKAPDDFNDVTSKNELRFWAVFE